MSPLLLFSVLTAFCFASTPETDTPTPPLGYWVTYDHGDPSSVIQIKKSASGSYYGVVVAGLFHGDAHPEAYCTECSDATWTGKYGIRKDEKVLGKSVFWDFTQEGDVWTHGQIIRVKSGNLFDASFTLADDNRALNMKVNVGFFKKTVTWTALSEEKLRQYCTHKEAFHQNGKTLAIECIDALSKEPIAVPSLDNHSAAGSTTDTDSKPEDGNTQDANTPTGDSSTPTQTVATTDTSMVDTNTIEENSASSQNPVSASNSSQDTGSAHASSGTDNNTSTQAPSAPEASSDDQDSSSSQGPSPDHEFNSSSDDAVTAENQESHTAGLDAEASSTNLIEPTPAQPNQRSTTPSELSNFSNTAPAQKTPSQASNTPTGSCGSHGNATPDSNPSEESPAAGQKSPNQASNTQTGSCGTHNPGDKEAHADSAPESNQEPSTDNHTEDTQGSPA